MTSQPPGWPPPDHPPLQADPGQGPYPPPQGDPAYPPQAGWAPPQPGWPATEQPTQGWMPAPLGGDPTMWARPGWPPPAALPPPASPVQASGPLGFPPTGYPPGHPPAPAPRRSAWPAVAIVVGVLAVVGVIVALMTQQWSPAPTVGDQSTVEVTGGDIGTAVELTGPAGSGRVTVTAARWTSEGEVGPVPGTSYLVVDVQLEGVSGELTTGGVFTAVVAADGRRHGISYGPVLDPLLTSRVLRAGETNAGHLAYQLAPGPVELEFQTPDGVVLGTVGIPGP